MQMKLVKLNKTDIIIMGDGLKRSQFYQGEDSINGFPCKIYLYEISPLKENRFKEWLKYKGFRKPRYNFNAYYEIEENK
jgi:hypothetical protein